MPRAVDAQRPGRSRPWQPAYVTTRESKLFARSLDASVRSHLHELRQHSFAQFKHGASIPLLSLWKKQYLPIRQGPPRLHLKAYQSRLVIMSKSTIPATRAGAADLPAFLCCFSSGHQRFLVFAQHLLEVIKSCKLAILLAAAIPAVLVAAPPTNQHKDASASQGMLSAHKRLCFLQASCPTQTSSDAPDDTAPLRVPGEERRNQQLVLHACLWPPGNHEHVDAHQTNCIAGSEIDDALACLHFPPSFDRKNTLARARQPRAAMSPCEGATTNGTGPLLALCYSLLAQPAALTP